MERNNEFRMDSMSIAEIAYNLGNSLYDRGVSYCELRIPLNARDFEKVDEDLFYRNRGEGSTEQFTPSDSEIDVKVGIVRVIFIKKVDAES